MWAQEMKNLVADIKTSHRDRTKYVKDVKEGTKDLIARFRGELREMARELKDFLAKSEETRKKDFAAMIANIRARVRDIKGDTADLLAQFDKEMKELAADLKEFLSKSEATRMADFRALMKDVVADIETIRKAIKDLLTGYKAERKEAAGYWGRLEGKEEAPEEVPTPAPEKEEAPAPKAKKKRKK